MAQPDDSRQRTALFRALTGNTNANVGGGDVAGMLRTVYGTTRRGEFRVDTREAAKRLGVSQRTVQRWLKSTHNPSTEHLKTLQTKSRQAVTTKRGRARAIRRATTGINAEARQKGANVTVAGNQGPGAPYARDRVTARNLSPEEYEDLLNAYAEGGDNAALEYLQSVWSEKYVDGWAFTSVDDMRLGEYDYRHDPRAI